MARKKRRPKQRESGPLAAVGDRKRRPASPPEAVSSSNGVPYPGPAYFIEELIMMVRESDAGASPSPVKREKR
jgi:hypothetical protein